MGRTSASQKASGGDDGRAGGRPSNDGPYKRPTGANADGAPTLRNIIPWRDMEKKLAERLAAKAAAGELSKDGLPMESKPPSSKPPPWRNDIEPAPDSGVRTSAEGTGPKRDLTYSVYTLDDLEARAQARPPRMTMSVPPPVAPPLSRWADVGKSGLVLARAWWTCVRTPKPRPRVMDVCRVPFATFLTDLKLALGALPWKKLALGLGVAVGAVMLLLGLVLTTAELTDDLKPRRSRSSLRTTDPALDAPVVEGVDTSGSTSVAPSAARPAVTQPVVPAPVVPAPVVAPVAPGTSEPVSIEIDDEPPPPAKAATKAAAPRASASPAKKPAAKKKAVELFVP